MQTLRLPGISYPESNACTCIICSTVAVLPACLFLQVRERNSRSQQLRLDTMFQDAAAKAAARKQEEQEADALLVEAEQMLRDVEDLVAGGTGSQDQAKAAQQRGRACVIAEEEDVAAAAAAGTGPEEPDAAPDAMQVVQAGLPEQQKDQQARQQQQQQVPDRVTDYAAWVKWQKQRWRAGRQESKRCKVEAAKRSAAEQETPQVSPLAWVQT